MFILLCSPFILSRWLGSDGRAVMVGAEHRLPWASSELSSFRLAVFVPGQGWRPVEHDRTRSAVLPVWPSFVPSCDG